MKIKTKYIILAICLLCLIITVVIATNKTSNSETPIYSDTVYETFDVEFLTENNQTNKDEYTNTLTKYINYIKELELKIDTTIANLDFSQENIYYKDLKVSFPEYKDQIIKAELYKKGFIVKKGIVTQNTNYNMAKTYIFSDNFTTISAEKLKEYGIQEEEILRYFKVRNTTNNMIVLYNNHYQTNNTDSYLPTQTIFVFAEKDGEIILYGEYPIRLNTYDASFTY